MKSINLSSIKLKAYEMLRYHDQAEMADLLKYEPEKNSFDIKARLCNGIISRKRLLALGIIITAGTYGIFSILGKSFK